VLNELKVTSFQITVDGNEETHNKRRPHANGGGTFATIIGNMVNCKDILPNISLRVNVDKSNPNAIEEITEILREKELLDKVKPYLGRVRIDGETQDESGCFDACGFSELEYNHYKSAGGNTAHFERYPRLTSNFCNADKLNSYTIAPDGRLYKCWHDIGGNDRCVGSLIKMQNITKAHTWVIWFMTLLLTKCVRNAIYSPFAWAAVQ
jgi:uncharacterized protein